MNVEQYQHVSAMQIKAARALLDWSQEDLAVATGLSVATVRKLEFGHVSPRGKTNDVIRRSFEAGGLEFIEPNGVRQRPEGIQVYYGEKGVREFFDDVYQTSCQTNAEIVQVWASARQIVRLLGDYREHHAKRMIGCRDRVPVKCVLTEDSSFLPSIYCEYRFLSRHFVDSVPFYVYGDKYAIIPFASDDEHKVLVIQSKAASDSFRLQFNSMWSKAAPIDNLGKTLPVRE